MLLTVVMVNDFSSFVVKIFSTDFLLEPGPEQLKIPDKN